MSELRELDTFILILLVKAPGNALRWVGIRNFVSDLHNEVIVGGISDLKHLTSKSTIGVKVHNSLVRLVKLGLVKKEIYGSKNVWYSIANEEIRQRISEVLDKLEWFTIEEIYFVPVSANLVQESDTFEIFKQKFSKIEEKKLEVIYLDMKMQRMGIPSILRSMKINEIADFHYNYPVDLTKQIKPKNG